MSPVNFFRLTLLFLASVACAAAGAGEQALPGSSIYQLNATLTDQSGRTLAWNSQRGRPRVISMFYSSCPYMCPLIVDSGKAIEHSLTAQEQSVIGITLVSLDPARDTPVVLARLGAKRKLDWRRWTLLRPAPGDVRALAGLLGVRYRALANGEFNHNSVLLLIDPQGRILARTDKVGAVLDPDFLNAVHRALRLKPPTS